MISTAMYWTRLDRKKGEMDGNGPIEWVDPKYGPVFSKSNQDSTCDPL